MEFLTTNPEALSRYLTTTGRFAALMEVQSTEG